MVVNPSQSHADDTSDVSHLYRFDRPARFVETWDDVDEDALDFFQSTGYLVVRQAFSQTEVESALEGLLDLLGGSNSNFTGVSFEAWAEERVKTMVPHEKQDYVRKLDKFVDHDQRLAHIAHHPELLQVMEALIGEAPTLFQDMALLKPPGGGREKPWHQDNAYFNIPPGTPVVGAWIALDEASADNGCMHVIPGTHLEGPVIHFQRRDWQICDTDVDVLHDVYVPLPPGGCLFFHGMVHHGTAPNRSNKRRRALQFHYAPTSVVRTSQEERLAVWGSEGKDVEC